MTRSIPRCPTSGNLTPQTMTTILQNLVAMGLVDRWFKPPLWLSTLIFVPIRRLHDGSFLAKLYPSPYDREKDRKRTREFVERTFGVRVLEGYGLSETAPAVCFNQLFRPSRPGT